MAHCIKPLCGQDCACCSCAVDNETWALIHAERERCCQVAMLAPFREEKCEDDGAAVAMSLKAMAFDITLRIRRPDFDERLTPGAAQGGLFP